MIGRRGACGSAGSPDSPAFPARCSRGETGCRPGLIVSRMGKPIGADTGEADPRAFRALREGDLHLIRLGSEFPDLTDSVAPGGRSPTHGRRREAPDVAVGGIPARAALFLD